MTRSLTLGILFSTVKIAAVAANLVIIGISLLISLILALRVVSTIFFILALYTSFLLYHFLLHQLVYLNQHWQVQIY